MADNDGVSQLLKAEAEANKIIQQAQEERLKELKQAKIVAEEEIKQFRNQEEQRLKEEIKKRFGNTQEEDDLESKTQGEIAQINQAYDKKKQEVIDLLIQRVMTVDLQIPNVVKRALSQKK